MPTKINMSKGDAVSFTKAEAQAGIVAENGWKAYGKDYDLKACVLLRNGDQVYVGAANADEKLELVGAITHGGDVRAPGVLEKITCKWHPDIARVALSSYSALENGSGSFNEYGVFVRATSGSKVVEIPAEKASASGSSYTCLFAEIIYNEDGTMDLVGMEDYSKSFPASENRVGYVVTKRGFRKGSSEMAVKMDAGPRGQTK